MKETFVEARDILNKAIWNSDEDWNLAPRAQGVTMQPWYFDLLNRILVLVGEEKIDYVASSVNFRGENRGGEITTLTAKSVAHIVFEIKSDESVSVTSTVFSRDRIVEIELVGLDEYGNSDAPQSPIGRSHSSVMTRSATNCR